MKGYECGGKVIKKKVMGEKYGGEILEPELRPEWIKKMKKRQLEPTVKIGTLMNFRKRYGLS